MGVAPLAVDAGPPLGLFEEAVYAESSFNLGPGERLAMYSDGITEAFDPTGQRQFGEERLVAKLEAAGLAGSIEDLGAGILRDVASFAGTAPQSDDITLLILERTRATTPGPMAVHLKGTQVTAGNAIDRVDALGRGAGLPEALRNDVLVVVDEIVSNVLKYGGVEREQLEVGIELSVERGVLALRFTDNAAPFDALSASAPRLDLPAQERAAGGLGIHLVKSLTDAQRYARENGRNVLTLTRAFAA